jgi:hypothetical protein
MLEGFLSASRRHLAIRPMAGIERLRSASAVLKGPSLEEAGQKKRRKSSSPRSSSYVIKSICDSPRVETIVMPLNLLVESSCGARNHIEDVSPTV